MDGDKEPDEGSRAVYGDWLLLRTRELLPDFVSIPESIPELVQETYQEPNAEQLDDIHRKAWEKQADSVKTQKEKAKNYRIPKPSGRRSSTLDGWLNVELPVDGARGEAAVRDGEPNIAVLVMQRHTDGRVTFLPWQEGGREVDPSHVPDDETARQIARQKLTLPLSFSLYGRDEQTIRELETRNRRELSEWQNSGWLSGELILLLDDSLCAELCGKHIRYTQEYGLVCERIGDDNEF
jgi:CRISPR-associated endonuclease/helicase Cas3